LEQQEKRRKANRFSGRSGSFFVAAFLRFTLSSFLSFFPLSHEKEEGEAEEGDSAWAGDKFIGTYSLIPAFPPFLVYKEKRKPPSFEYSNIYCNYFQHRPTA